MEKKCVTSGTVWWDWSVVLGTVHRRYCGTAGLSCRAAEKAQPGHGEVLLMAGQSLLLAGEVAVSLITPETVMLFLRSSGQTGLSTWHSALCQLCLRSAFQR